MTSCPPWVKSDDPPELAELLTRLGGYHQNHEPYSRQFAEDNVERRTDELVVTVPIQEPLLFDRLNQHFGLRHIIWTDGNSADVIVAIVKLHELPCWPCPVS